MVDRLASLGQNLAHVLLSNIIWRLAGQIKKQDKTYSYFGSDIAYSSYTYNTFELNLY